MESNVDVSNIKQEDCAKGLFPLDQGMQRQGFQILVKRSVLNAMQVHGRNSMHAEICGVLVGELLWDSFPFLYIEGSIEGRYADYNVASVTFPSKTWDYIHEELSGKYPEKKIVGWYHTHPGFGIFLSEMDMFINRNFFNFPWQTAYVYDPQAEKSGFFVWKDSLMKPVEAEILEDSLAIPSMQEKDTNRNDPIQNSSAEKCMNIAKVNTFILIIALMVSLIALGLTVFTYLKAPAPATDQEVIQLYQEKINRLKMDGHDCRELNSRLKVMLVLIRSMNDSKALMLEEFKQDIESLEYSTLAVRCCPNNAKIRLPQPDSLLSPVSVPVTKTINREDRASSSD